MISGIRHYLELEATHFFRTLLLVEYDVCKMCNTDYMHMALFRVPDGFFLAQVSAIKAEHLGESWMLRRVPRKPSWHEKQYHMHFLARLWSNFLHFFNKTNERIWHLHQDGFILELFSQWQVIVLETCRLLYTSTIGRKYLMRLI